MSYLGIGHAFFEGYQREGPSGGRSTYAKQQVRPLVDSWCKVWVMYGAVGMTLIYKAHQWYIRANRIGESKRKDVISRSTPPRDTKTVLVRVCDCHLRLVCCSKIMYRCSRGQDYSSWPTPYAASLHNGPPANPVTYISVLPFSLPDSFMSHSTQDTFSVPQSISWYEGLQNIYLVRIAVYLNFVGCHMC